MSRRRQAEPSVVPLPNAYTSTRRSVVGLALLASTYLVLSAVPGGLAFQGRYPRPVRRLHVPRSTMISLSPRGASPSDQTSTKTKQSSRAYSSMTWPQGTAEDSSWEDVLNPIPYPTPEHKSITLFDKVALGGSVALAAAALFLLIGLSDPGSWRYFLAGGICAATSHAIPVPIDVVKTRKQVDVTLANKTFLKASKQIMKEEGPWALWAGLGPTAWGYLIEGAIKFGVYEVLKPVVTRVLSNLASWTSIALFRSQIMAFIICGIFSGVAASLMLCPMEALRIRMVSEAEYAEGGMVAGGLKMLRREGVAGFAKGISPMIMKQVPYTVTKNVSFDVFTKLFYSIMRAQGMAISAATAFTVPLVSASIASILSCISSQPGDMVLSLVNAREGDIRSREIYRDIIRVRGFRGFFVGFKTRMLHVGIIVTLQLLIYDYVKRLCGIAATGM